MAHNQVLESRDSSEDVHYTSGGVACHRSYCQRYIKLKQKRNRARELTTRARTLQGPLVASSSQESNVLRFPELTAAFTQAISDTEATLPVHQAYAQARDRESSSQPGTAAGPSAVIEKPTPCHRPPPRLDSVRRDRSSKRRDRSSRRRDRSSRRRGAQRARWWQALRRALRWALVRRKLGLRNRARCVRDGPRSSEMCHRGPPSRVVWPAAARPRRSLQ